MSESVQEPENNKNRNLKMPACKQNGGRKISEFFFVLFSFLYRDPILLPIRFSMYQLFPLKKQNKKITVVFKPGTKAFFFVIVAVPIFMPINKKKLQQILRLDKNRSTFHFPASPTAFSHLISVCINLDGMEFFVCH